MDGVKVLTSSALPSTVLLSTAGSADIEGKGSSGRFVNDQGFGQPIKVPTVPAEQKHRDLTLWETVSDRHLISASQTALKVRNGAVCGQPVLPPFTSPATAGRAPLLLT